VDELHREIGLRAETRIRGTGFVDLRYAWMVQSAERPRLVLKPAALLGSGEARFDDFESYDAAGAILFGSVDDTHSTFAEEAQNPVSSDIRRLRGDFILCGRIIRHPAGFF